MKEYKVVINEERIQVSALHIPIQIYNLISEEELTVLINKWLKEIKFTGYVVVADKGIECETKIADKESIKCINNNNVEYLIIAYSHEQHYDISKHIPRRTHKRNNKSINFEE